MNYLIGFAIVSVLLVIFREKWLMLIGDFLTVEYDLHPADVIHVIAGEDYRTEYAIYLYQQGYGKTLFFTGGWCTLHSYNHGEHAEELSLLQGVPQETIAYDDSTVTSTYMEAERLKDWIDQSLTPIQSVIVVSDPFHMRRARWAYEKVLGKSIEIQMAPVPFEQTPYQLTWWRDRQSRNYIRDEYIKFGYYIFAYQLSTGDFQKWLVSLDTQ